MILKYASNSFIPILFVFKFIILEICFILVWCMRMVMGRNVIWQKYPRLTTTQSGQTFKKFKKTDYFHFLKIAMVKIFIYDFQFDKTKEVK